MNKAWLTMMQAGLALGLAAGAIGASAQGLDGGRGRQLGAKLQKRFTAADANGDGQLTRDEAKSGMPFVYKHFDEIDAAKSGAISMADIVAFVRGKQRARKSAAP